MTNTTLLKTYQYFCTVSLSLGFHSWCVFLGLTKSPSGIRSGLKQNFIYDLNISLLTIFAILIASSFLLVSKIYHLLMVFISFFLYNKIH